MLTAKRPTPPTVSFPSRDAAWDQTTDAPIGSADEGLSPFAESRLEAQAQRHNLHALKARLVDDLAKRLAPEHSGISLQELDEATDVTQIKVAKLAQQVVAAKVTLGEAGRGRLISPDEARALVQYLLAVQFGAGVFQPLFEIPDVEDIVISTRQGQGRKKTVEIRTFRASGKVVESLPGVTEADVIQLVNRAAQRDGRLLSPVHPTLDATLMNGARVNGVMAPVSPGGACVTIRIHRLIARSLADLVVNATIPAAAAQWLDLCVQASLAMVVAGGTSSGKTNLLNALVRQVPAHERIVCIEDTRELNLAAEDREYLLTLDNKDEPARSITQRHLVANALRMRPDRIVIGEVRTGAAFDALKACNTGHEGTLLTLHADDATSVPARLIELAREAPESATMPEATLHTMVARAFQQIVFVRRMRTPGGGTTRKLAQIIDVPGDVANGQISLTPLFELEHGTGPLTWTRIAPSDRTLERLARIGWPRERVLALLRGGSR